MSAKDDVVFDNSKCGRRVFAERKDEPGNEKSKPGDGGGGNGDPKRAARILAGDPEGDWSWKPGRDATLGKNFSTFKGVAPGAAEVRAR